MGITETAAAAHEEVSKFAQEFLIQESKLAPLVTDYSAMAVKGANSVALPRAGGFSVVSKGEGSAITPEAITYAKDQIALDVHRAVQFNIEDIADLQSNVAQVQEAVMRATKALALDWDEQIITELRLASASAPDHLIKFNDTVNEDVELIDILNARKLLIDQNLDPRECYMGVGSDQEKNMLGIENFIDTSRYGSSEAIQAGELGKIFGMRVIVHTSLTQEALFWHPSAVGFAFQQGVKFQTETDLANLSNLYSLSYLAGFQVLDGGKRNVQISETA